MQKRNWILLAVAVAIGLVAVLIANAWFTGMEQQQAQTEQAQKDVAIVVASQPLDFGSRLTSQNVALRAWPANSVPQGAFRTVKDALKNDRVALRPIVPGEPVLASKVSGVDGRATLAALLEPGMRAVSIPITAVRGVSGFVLPGTLVDVLLTRKIPGEGAESEDLRSDVILENVQVLAVDQLSNDKEGTPKVGKTATLAVTLRDAQRLAIAEKIGTMSLVLRRLEDASPADSGTRTITNRNLGVPNLRIAPKRKAGSTHAGNTGLPADVFGPGAPAPSGPSMIVIRGTEATSYPVARTGGR